MRPDLNLPKMKAETASTASASASAHNDGIVERIQLESAFKEKGGSREADEPTKVEPYDWKRAMAEQIERDLNQQDGRDER